MRIATFLIAPALALMLGVPAAAQDFNFEGEPYVGVHGGFNWREDSSSSQISDQDVNNSIKFDTDYNASLSLGYELADLPVRPALELSYISSDVDNLTVSGQATPASVLAGDLEALNLMGNVFYDKPLTDNVDLYLGAGAGFSRLTADFKGEGLVDFDEDTDTVFAYQFMAGVGWHYSERTIVDVGYRYWDSTDPDYDFGEIESSPTHLFEIGVRYRF